jgi:hypothetical protein
MTIDQYKLHEEIVSELRRQFIEFWSNTALPAMKDSDIEMSPEEQVESMNHCWRQWKSDGLKNGSLAWFFNWEPNYQN